MNHKRKFDFIDNGQNPIKKCKTGHDSDYEPSTYESSTMSESSENDLTDTDETESTESQSESSESESIGSQSSSSSSDSDDETVQELLDEHWFHKLSKPQQQHYIDKLKRIAAYEKKIPTVKDILDMPDLPKDSAKLLIFERKKLDDHRKLSPVYDTMCKQFLLLLESLIDPQYMERRRNIKSVKDKILAADKYSVSIHDRIMMSHFDDKVKSIIYDKYLQMINMDSDEASKYRAWIETALSIPYMAKPISIDKPIDQVINRMSQRLDKKIYGMREAKEELLCIVANMINNPNTKNKAIGMYGPPGIGKTMIVGILAEELNLPKEQIALGGVTDSCFLEGHNFTYVGSSPGAIVKSIVKMGYTNGIIYLDEIDKISKTDKGKEIEHCLLHITDFTQNHDFRDKYISEIPINLSNYVFIYSMNSIRELDSALASRIPVVKFDGYNLMEKCEIVKKFLLPELLPNYDLNEADVIITDDAVRYLVKVVREDGTNINGTKSGVRGLKKVLNKILSRINLHKLSNGNTHMSFRIKNFSLPYTLTTEFIDQVVGLDRMCVEPVFPMYT